jgi:hypothetical protein
MALDTAVPLMVFRLPHLLRGRIRMTVIRGSFGGDCIAPRTSAEKSNSKD